MLFNVEVKRLPGRVTSSKFEIETVSGVTRFYSPHEKEAPESDQL